MRTKSNLILLSLLLLMLLVGCSAPKNLVKDSSAGGMAKLSSLPAFNREIECLSGNVRMTAVLNGESVTAKGKLRIKSSEGIQVSATAMGLMEAACFEFLPQVGRFIYKIDKIYAEASYSAVPFLEQTGTDYALVEALLLNAIFSPDGRQVKKALKSMRYADEGDFVTFTTPESYPVVYKFFIEKCSGNLVRCEGSYGSVGSVVCVYNDFVVLDGVSFPALIELQFDGEGTTALLTFKMSNLKNNGFDFSPRRISDAYTRVSIEGVIDSVGNSVE